MQNLIKNFVNDESGATAIEYGLIAALIAVAMIAGATQLGQSIDDKFKDVAVTLNTVDETAGTVTNGAD
ncbi:MAG: Flp family type IVb pilin [Litorimonas sp.]